MNKVKSLEDLKRMREKLHSDINIRENSNDPDSLPQIKVSMGTCGIAAGAKEVMSLFVTTLKDKKIDAVVTQSGCMGYCHAEPTVEVKVPGKESIVYGHVTPARVGEIVEKYIKEGELVEGIIPRSHSDCFQ
jgi:NADP-reducing hydrogenase subunit HndB